VESGDPCGANCTAQLRASLDVNLDVLVTLDKQSHVWYSYVVEGGAARGLERHLAPRQGVVRLKGGDMIDDNEGAKAGRGRVKEMTDPVRVTIRIEAETHRRLRYAMADRREQGISRIIEEACRLWLETHAAEGTKS